MQLAGWLVAIALAFIVGFVGGTATGKNSERSTIANECRQAGAFTLNRTAFDCGVRKK